MRPFALSSAGSQFLLMLYMLLNLIIILFLCLISFTKDGPGKKGFCLLLFLIQFAALSWCSYLVCLIDEGLLLTQGMVVPMGCIWLIEMVLTVYLLWSLGQVRKFYRMQLSNNSIKEAIDQLPSGVCYFTEQGTVKLCNRQMHHLYHSIMQTDLQTIDELRQALEDCDSHTGILCLSRERKNYLFPDGKAWHYSESHLTGKDGTSYTEAVFSDVTDQYEKNLELIKQTEQLQTIAEELKALSDNALLLTREKEILSAKTRLHDQMGGCLTVLRQSLLLDHNHETTNVADLLRHAVSAIKNDNKYLPEKTELQKFIQDAGTIGVTVHLTGHLPEDEQLYDLRIMAMRECLINGVRHAQADQLFIEMTDTPDHVGIHITNNGLAPKEEIVPKGGLQNLSRNVQNLGGTMKIQSFPVFALELELPKEQERKI